MTIFPSILIIFLGLYGFDCRLLLALNKEINYKSIYQKNPKTITGIIVSFQTTNEKKPSN